MGKKALPSLAINPGPAQREQTETLIFQFLLERGLTTYFSSCFLWVQLPISLHLGADGIVLFGGSCCTSNSWEPLRTKKVARIITKI